MKKVSSIEISTLFLVIFLLFSCQGNNIRKKQEDVIIVKDDLDRDVKIKKDAKRFLPFAPSVTEIMYLFCDSSEIVGRTQNCNYPPVALTKPIVNNYPPDLEKILLLKPDLLITKDGMLSIEQASAIEKMGIPVYFQTYDSVSSIFKGIKTLSSLTNHADKGIRVADSLEDILKKEHVNVSGNPPKVLMLISKDSYFCFGKNTYASDILRQCGAVNAVDSIFENPYPILSAEYILKTNPDLILGGPEVGLDKDFFELHPELKRTKAFKIKQYYSINEDYLSRPGPRVVEAVRAIRALLEKENSSPQR